MSSHRRLYSEVALRHPQMQKEFVYIYNDFAGNGQCEVIENTLMEISSALGAAPRSDAALLRAWHLLEGLSVFVLTFFSEWTGVEDSAYVHVLVEVYASAVLTLSKALHEAGLLAKIHNAAQVRFLLIAQTTASFFLHATSKLSDRHYFASSRRRNCMSIETDIWPCCPSE